MKPSSASPGAQLLSGTYFFGTNKEKTHKETIGNVYSILVKSGV